MPETGSFQQVLSAAIDDLLANGFDSVERVQRWMRELRMAADRSLVSPESIEDELRRGLAGTYRRMVDRGGLARFNPGVERFTLDRIRPALRSELDRRIMASADLIRLNREQAIDKTLQRFAGWSTSIPKGGTDAASKAAVKRDQKKAMGSLPFEERRVLIDQGHKLVASLNEIVATDGGAIAGRWRSNWRQPGYDYREDHRDRDERVYLIRGSWADRAGLVKPRRGWGYADDITRPAEEPFCFPGDSRVPWVDRAEVAYRRWYSGQLAEVVTASGKTLRATPNHPVLTANGWVPLGVIQEGDHVVEIPNEIIDLTEDNQNDAVPKIAQIFSALAKGGGLQSTREGKLYQFHGDGTNGDVDIVSANRPLSFNAKSTASEFENRLLFALAGLSAALGCASDALAIACARAAARVMGSLGQPLTSMLSFAGHPHDHRGAAPASRSAGPFDLVADHLAGNAELPGERQDAFTCHMPPLQFTRIERTRRIDFAGHVFNLQTEKGWYVTDGIVVHNCRCYYIYLYNLRDLPEDMLTTKGKQALFAVLGAEEVRSARFARGDARADAEKMSKAAAEYVGPYAPRPQGKRCDGCTMFAGQLTCTAVIGDVDTGGYCRLHEPDLAPALSTRGDVVGNQNAGKLYTGGGKARDRHAIVNAVRKATRGHA
jgi:hypothetical protein